MFIKRLLLLKPNLLHMPVSPNWLKKLVQGKAVLPDSRNISICLLQTTRLDNV
jgi:hypothetical protein